MVDNTLVSKIPERIGRIDELAHNIWWSWHPKARDLFRALDYPLWRYSGHNPVKELAETSPDRLKFVATDPNFLALYDSVLTEFDNDMNSPNTWFQTNHAHALSGPVAYFSMEFALHNSLPIYAGGLGILAGDMCKEASDLGLPFIGVGFMYPQGYFHQHISTDGWQQEIYRQLNFNDAPINQILTPDGHRSIAQVKLKDRLLSIAVWQVRVGRVNIYLLDTNLEENTMEDRQLSARLYTADPEMRIQQEIILGIGGVRVLRALNINPQVWHANEGHSAFMALERIREQVEKGLSFDKALQTVQNTAVFTTHTPVPGGHDLFSIGLMDKYFPGFWPSLGIDRARFLEMGRPDSGGRDGFNMTALAINTANRRNAVSHLHELETKKMWRAVWPGLSEDQIPITHVTNGVHVPAWLNEGFYQLFDKYLGKDWLEGQDNVDLWKKVMDIPDEEIWAIHLSLKGRLMDVIMSRAQERWADGEVTAQQVVTMGSLLNPQALTVGFSRRFTEYKRPALILSDVERLKKIVTNPWYPVQIVFSGKSHPADFSGKYLLHKVYTQAQERQFQGRIAFIEDYDMHMARYLVHGIDVWLNTPVRRQEASGTSGMKAAINGIPNLSVRDGWWEEGYDGENGWAIGAGPEGAGSPDQDRNDAESLYRLLEEKVVPLYYQQDRNGISRGWVRMIKESICSVLPRFSACRMAKDYVEKLYVTTPEPAKRGA
jgi:glycogen phosphorylase